MLACLLHSSSLLYDVLFDVLVISSQVDAQAREYDGASKPDICKTDKGNITPHDFPRSVRSALGELELNGRNANAACRNPKRRRQQSVNEYSSNKENLVNYR